MALFVIYEATKTKTGKAATHVREWDAEKIAAFLQEGLEVWAADKYPDFEMRRAVSCQGEIRFENRKPEKKHAEELRAEIGEEIGQIMEGTEPEDYLSESAVHHPHGQQDGAWHLALPGEEFHG